MDQTQDDSQPVPPLQRHLQLETDLFCFGCGYNLHGQIVTHDERLGFLVCRCPECGRFHPAAMGVSATRPWLARLGVSLIMSWILTALVVIGLLSFFIGLMNYAHFETYTTYANQNYNSATRFRVIRNITTNNPGYYDEYWAIRWHYFVAFAAALSTALGVFFAVAMWHVAPARRWRILIWPVVVSLLTFLIWYGNENITSVFSWSVDITFRYMMLNLATMTLGLLIGRPVTRSLCRMLIPPRLLQHVHFLWRCDGLTPPSTKGA